ncbi:MAG: fimbrillin family protein [Bacteroidales bacterium]|jgi:hypothetical protein|nr:fimbrillin family protein [Bacteroidales bacterium]
MKNRNLFFFLATGFFLLSGCKEEAQVAPSEDVTVKFNPNISVSKTKASGASWDAGDAIGVFMVEQGSTTVADAANNKKYGVESAGTSGVFSPAAPADDNVIYYPNDGSSVDFIAYYPYQASITALSTFPVDVSNQSSPAAIDLLYAATTTGYSKSHTGTVPLAFSHQLSKLTLNVTAGTGVNSSDLANLSIAIQGLNTAATFHLADGTLSGAGAVANITPFTVTAGATYAALVIPQTIASGTVSIEFSIAAITYSKTWNMPSGVIEKGVEYRYDVVLSSSGADVTGTINDWQTGNTNHPAIPLTAPADATAINLEESTGLSFAWTAVPQISDYLLELSLSSNMASPQTIAATANPFSVSVAELDAAIEALGLTGTITTATPVYWCIRPASPGIQPTKTVRSLSVTRVPVIVLGSPADAATINAGTFMGSSYSFTWTPVNDPSVTGYTLKISISDQFPNDPTTQSFAVTGNTTDHYDLDDATCDALLLGLGVDPARQTAAPLYWTVEAEGVTGILTQVRSFHAIRKGVQLAKSGWGVTVSGTYSGTPEGMLDNDETTFWYSNGPSNNWLADVLIDMTAVKTISSIRIACWHNIKYGWMYASETLQGSWPGDAPEIGTIVRETTNWLEFYWDIPLALPMNARYLYIYLNDSHGNGYHGINEVTVYGNDTALP